MRALRWASNAWTIVLLLTVLLSALMVGGRFVVPRVADPPALLAATPPNGAGDVPLRARPTLRFTTPMNPRTVERALRIDPALQAQLQWDESFTTLTISPTVLLRPETRYRITFAHPVLSRQLGELAPFALAFQTVQAPVVTASYPADGSTGVDTSTPLVIAFSRAMVGPSALATPTLVPQLRIEPPIGGQVTWLNPRTALFKPEHSFAPGTSYRVTLDAALADAQGGMLGRAVSWQFETQAPEVLALQPANEASVAAAPVPITVTLSAPLATPLPNDLLSTTPPVSATLSAALQVDGSQVLTLQPQHAWQAGVSYDVTLRLPGAEPQTWTFRAERPPALVGRFPGEGQMLPPGQEIRLIFSVPVDRRQFAERARFDPPAEFSVSGDGGELRVEATLRAATPYTLTLPADLTDIHGVPLGRAYQIRFITAPALPLLQLPEFTARRAQVAPGQPADVLVRRTNLSMLQITLYTLDEATLVRTLAFDDVDWQLFEPERYGQTQLRTWTVPLSDTLNTLAEDRVTLAAPDGGNLAPGAYYLRIRTPEGPRADMVVLVSRVRLALQLGDRFGTVWATDSLSDTVLAQLPVALYQDDALLLEGVTDGRGILSFPISNREPATYAALARGEQIGLVSFGPFAPQRPADTRYRMALFAQSGVVEAGNSIHVAGFVREVLTDTLQLPTRATSLTLTLRDQRDRVLASARTNVMPTGVLSATLPLATTLEGGRYRVRAEIGSQRQEIDVVVRSAIAGADLVRVLLDPQQDEAGTLRGSVYVAQPNGLPRAGATITWTLTPEIAQAPLSDEFVVGGGPLALPAPRTGVATTDRDGWASVVLTNSLALQNPLRYRFEAQLATAPSVVASDSVVQHPTDVYVGVRPARQVVEARQTSTFETVAVDQLGRPRQGVDIRFVVFNAQDRPLVERESATDTAGRAVFDATLQAGSYRIEASVPDGRGGRSTTLVPLWVVQPGRNIVAGATSLQLVADQTRYAAGQLATLLPTLPYTSALALVTAETEQARSVDVRPIQAGDVLTTTLTPAGHTRVSLLTLPQADGRPAWAQTELRVAPTAAMSMTLNADLVAQAAQPLVRIHVQLRDPAGSPQPGDVVVAVFRDDGMLPASGDLAEMMPGAFAVAVGNQSWSRQPDAPLSRPYPASGVLWSGPLRTAADGSLTFEARLPGDVRDVRVVAWAAAGATLVRQDVWLQRERLAGVSIHTPVGARVGDQIEIAARVNNTTGTTQTVSLGLDRVRGLQLAPPETAQVTIGPAAHEQAAWRGIVQDGVLVQARAQVRAGDQLLDTLPISLAVVPEHTYIVTAAGALAEGTLVLALPNGAAQEDQAQHLVVEVAVSADALARQRAMALGRQSIRSTYDEVALLLLAAPFSDTAQLARESVARLVETQNGDGGWGPWPHMRSQPAVAAAVLEALTRAGQHGVEVPLRTRTLGLAALAGSRERVTGPDFEAQTAYLQALNGKADPGVLARLASQQNELGVQGLAFTLLAQHEAGTPVSPAVRETLIQRMQRSGQQSYWQASDQEETAAATALALRSLVVTGDTAAIERSVVRWLAAVRGQSSVANALADARVIDALRQVAPSGANRAVLTVGREGPIEIDSGDGTGFRQIERDLAPGASAGTLALTSTQTAFVRYEIRSRRPPIQQTEVFVGRDYLDPATGALLDPNALVVGQIVRVRVTVFTPGVLGAVHLRDGLPLAGIAEQLSPQGAFEYVASGQHDVEAVANRLDPGIHLFTYTIMIDAAGQYRAPAPVVLGPGGIPIAIGIERSIAVRR